MKPIVLDASATAPWFIPEEATPVSDQLYADLMSGTAPFCAPALWLWETANLLLVAKRRRRLEQDAVERALLQLGKCPIQFDPLPDGHRRAQTLRLAGVHELSYYDAAYLELALRLNSQLASTDRKLVAAAKSCGIHCLEL